MSLRDYHPESDLATSSVRASFDRLMVGSVDADVAFYFRERR